MKIINHYTKSKKKVSYLPFMRLLFLFSSCVITSLARLRRRRFIAPALRKVFIETLSFCNNDCSFCPASRIAKIKNPQHRMSDETFEKIITQLQQIKFEGTLSLYCNNEPLIDSRIPYFIEKLRCRFPMNKIEIITNGINLTVSLAEKVFSCGLSVLIINHYDNALLLSESLKKFVEDFSKSPHHSKVSIYLRLKDEALSNRVGNAANTKHIDKFLPLWCCLPFEQLYLNYAGEVILCCSDVLWEMQLGNVNRNPIEEIWQNKEFSRIRNALLDGRRDKVGICKRCDFLGIKHEPKAFLSTVASLFSM